MTATENRAPNSDSRVGSKVAGTLPVPSDMSWDWLRGGIGFRRFQPVDGPVDRLETWKPIPRKDVPDSDVSPARRSLLQRRARDSNPQPVARHLISSQAAHQFAYPPSPRTESKALVAWTGSISIQEGTCHRTGFQPVFRAPRAPMPKAIRAISSHQPQRPPNVQGPANKTLARRQCHPAATRPPMPPGRRNGVWSGLCERASNGLRWFLNMTYIVEFAESVKEQLASLTARQRSLVLEAIGKQLVHQPLVETRNRKPLRPNPVAPWELRVRELRVFYEVADDEPGVVRVLAVGRKRGNKVVIAGLELEL